MAGGTIVLQIGSGLGPTKPQLGPSANSSLKNLMIQSRAAAAFVCFLNGEKLNPKMEFEGFWNYFSHSKIL